ncbi:protein-export membrane protein SecF [Saccharospirillum sp. MSK14-1]|uniref:protein translocase subunit SecF n=1 Tax=Saccharospirillum sp. MSK14-1 TaxID=1897632 RepID=UPI000D3C1340|nr:protein translocase subunit SecF [Saccharospirillum sp. MSK14-1]PTY35904.1 protein-export membrane protein SecF [Saccharospirillum sp. MSK14-1]
MSEPKVYNFMGRRHLAAAFSITLLVIAVIALAVRGLNYGLDFTGGAQIEVGYEQPADVNQVRTVLTDAGYRDVVVQYFGNNTDVLIRMQEDNNPDLGNEVLDLLSAERNDVELRRNEYVGPQVGEELREKGGIGMIVALGLVMVYIALRFQFKFAIGAVAALIHDVIIVLGFFAVTQFPFDLTVLAAILAVIGYSLNDTIVVADRIRESFRTIRRDDPIYLVNISLTQTLSRTVITSLTTLLVLIALGIFGGEMIRAFAEALTVGVVIGTYSSIYVASNILLAMKLTKEDLMPPEKEQADEDEVPSWLTDPDDEKS